MRRPPALAFVLLVLSLVPAPLAEARGARLSFNEIVQDGQTIVAATVVSSSTRWGESCLMVWTDYELAVEEVWKGPAREALTVSFAGGAVDGSSVLVSDVPRLEVGETYVLALHDPGLLYSSPVVGSEQGLFREVKESGGGRILLDAWGFAVAIGTDGRLARVARAERAAASGTARLRGRAATAATAAIARPLGEPVYRDGEGHPLVAPQATPTAAVPARPSASFDLVPLTRTSLRDAVRRVLEGR